MKVLTIVGTGLAAIVACTGSIYAQPGIPNYTIEPILLPSPRSRTLGLNDLGQVVGGMGVSSFGPFTPFVWQAGTVTILPKPPGFDHVWATSIDSLGKVRGNSKTGTQDLAGMPIVWEGGQPIQIANTFNDVVTRDPVSSSSGQFVLIQSQPYDNPTPGWNNQNGWISEPDFTDTSGDPPLPMLMTGPSRTILGTWPGSVGAKGLDVNDSGQVVGSVGIGGWNLNRAVRWDAEQGAVLLGTLGGRASLAIAINNVGQVVGYSDFPLLTANINIDFKRHPWLWGNGAMQELGVLPGFIGGTPSDINVGGMVVGQLMATEN